ncbi:MAG: hypothetical protein ACRD38_10535, partial [Nitrososphaerales archaeon]
MGLLKERALIIFEEDVCNVELFKAIKAKIVTQMLPPHRYDCTFTVDNSLTFDGKEMLNGSKFKLDIPLP